MLLVHVFSTIRDSAQALSLYVYMFVILVVGNWNVCSGSDHFGTKVENISVDSEEFVRASSDIIDEMNKKQIRNVYMDVLKSYEELQFHKDHLEEAKNKILRYSYLW